MIKTINLLLLTSLLIASSCGDVKRYSEKRVIQIQGKPVNLAYMYHINAGKLIYSYEGFINGKVGVCNNYDCKNVAEYDFSSLCRQSDILQGDVSKINPAAGYEEEMDAGEYRCLVFIPESKNTTGEITVEFKEDPVGAW